jgi:beta-exotoxin I transport system permease protein
MFAVFKRSLRKSTTAIFGWGITLGALGMLFIPFYDTIAKNAEQFQKLFEIYPKEILAFFSEGGLTNFTTPEGFLSVEYFSFMPLVIGFFAVLAGSGLLAADEEHGVLDLIAAQPVSRSAIFWGRAAALFVSLVGILALGYAGVMLGTTFSIMDLDAVVALRPFASMLAFLIFFSGFSLALSMLLPSRQSAAMVSGIVLVAGFFLHGLANLNDSLAKVVPFIPHSYFQGDNWADSFKLDWFAILAGIGVMFTLIAWWRFLRRDIRVGGEGSWNFSRLFVWKKSPNKA